MRERSIVRTLLIDADDTLWENNIYYLRCTAQFVELLSSFGVDETDTRATLDETERSTILRLGYGPTSYRHSLGVTALELLKRRRIDPPADLVFRARACAEMLFEPPLLVLPGVKDTLASLRPSSRLVVMTKGEEAIQRAKVARSGLYSLFDHTLIVPEKDVETYRHVLTTLGLDTQRTWMVGNSPKSDINPAVEAGIGAVFIPHNDTWVAEHQEIASPERVVTLDRFADLLLLFGLDGRG